MARLFGIEFAPSWVPIERRLQTMMVLLYTYMFFAPVVAIIGFVALLFTDLFWMVIGYGAWMFYDVNFRCTSSRGGRRWEYMRHHWMWRYYVDYFPAKLIKTAELDPSKNYMFAAHPHGILGCGSFGNFSPEASGFSKLYPGITPHLLTLKANFAWPLLRGVLMWMGVCDVSKSSIEWILTKQGRGNAVVIVVGGAEEALLSKPGKHRVTLTHRKGFIKMAIKTGASLVPVYTFGETDLFSQVDNPEGSLIRSFQERFKKMFGFSPPFYYGRGVFNYSFGMMPHRRPIFTVVGAPIDVELNRNPSQEIIGDVHQKYTEQLKSLFDKNKTFYGIDEDNTLEFI